MMEALKVPGTLDSLGVVGQYVMASAAKAGLDKPTAYRLRLSVDEIMTNIIVHGYEEAGLHGDIKLWIDLDVDTLTLSVEDTAVPYDPRQAPHPDSLDKPLEERDIGGLGVYLAIEGVDEFRYERVNNCNRNIFVVKRNAVSPQSAQQG